MKAKKDHIISLPATNLRKRSAKVGLITTGVLKVVEDMKSATIDWEISRTHEVGVALAAVQINQLLRIVVVRNNPDNKKDTAFSILINPEITKLEGNLEKDFEGCLSIPEIYGKVPRCTKVRIKAKDLSGKTVRLKAEGFLARVLQHEIDHLNGKMFIDHIKDDKEAFYRLEANGNLTKLDYDKEIRSSSILW